MTRTVSVRSRIFGMDREGVFSSGDETAVSDYFDYEVELENGSPLHQFTKSQLRWGSECRCELYLSVEALDTGDVKLYGTGILFVGKSESTDDLDGRNDFNFVVPISQTIEKKYTVNNANKGDDYADITVECTNVTKEI